MSEIEQLRCLKLDLVEIIISLNSTITKADKEQAREYYQDVHGCGACDLQTIKTYVEQIKYGKK